MPKRAVRTLLKVAVTVLIVAVAARVIDTFVLWVSGARRSSVPVGNH
jgi:hypothetical protein